MLPQGLQHSAAALLLQLLSTLADRPVGCIREAMHVEYWGQLQNGIRYTCRVSDAFPQIDALLPKAQTRTLPHCLQNHNHSPVDQASSLLRSSLCHADVWGVAAVVLLLLNRTSAICYGNLCIIL